MIPIADLPSTDGVYVIHIDPPLAHAHGYTGWSTNIARRVRAHLDVEACRQAGYHLNADACRRAGGCEHRSPRSTLAATGSWSADSMIGTTRASALSAAPSARRGRVSIASRSPVVCPPLLVEGRALPRSGGSAMPDAHIDFIRRTPDGLCVVATFACSHRYETLYPRESSARRVSRAQVERWELPQGRATRCPACEGFGPHHPPARPQEAQP